MTLFELLLIYGAAALGFFLLIDGVGYLIANTGGRGASRAQRRLLGDRPDAPVEERVEAMARDDTLKSATSLGKLIERLIVRADSGLKVERVYIVMLVIAAAVFFTLNIFMPYLHWSVSAMLALALGVMLPLMHLNNKAQQRVDKFQEQFPDALDLIVRSLRVGHPLSAALSTIGNELRDPIAAEFRIAARQVTYGKTPPEAVASLAQRVDLPDVRFFAVAVQIHHEAGGNLAEILSGLAKIIRSRFQLFRKVHALTVEGRFSAWFLSIFPVGMAFVMNGMQPGYYEKVSDFPYFVHLIVVTVILLIVNVIAMRMMTKLEV